MSENVHGKRNVVQPKLVTSLGVVNVEDFRVQEFVSNVCQAVCMADEKHEHHTRQNDQ